MKFKIFTKSCLFLVALLIINGCDQEKFLEAKYTPQQPWQTVDQLELAVALPYSGFVQAGFSCPSGVYSFFDFLGSGLGKIIPDQTGNMPWDEFYGRKMRQTAVEAPSAAWLNSAFELTFISVLGANDALDYIEGGEREGKDLFPYDSKAKEDATIPRIKAELYFWRGYAYYWAALLYCPPYTPGGDNSERVLPLKITAANPQNTKVGTTQEIWDQLISDLKKAKSLMPKDWSKEGRINYYTICGALARAYFYTGNFADAQKECDEIIASNKYSLQSNVMAAWNSAPGEPQASEVMWYYLPNKFGQNILTPSAFSRADPYGTNGSRGANYAQCSWVFCTLSNEMIKKVGWMKDPQKGDFTATAEALADKRYGNTWFRLEGYKPKSELPQLTDVEYKNKYQSIIKSVTYPQIWLDKYYRGASAGNTRMPLMRVAEFYLMRSTIRLKNGDKNGAAADLKVIRDRAGLPEISATSISDSDIEREWIIELGGEGSFLPYLNALRKPIPVGDRIGVAPVQAPYSGWYWKIPIAEVKLNAGYNGFDPNSK